MSSHNRVESRQSDGWTQRHDNRNLGVSAAAALVGAERLCKPSSNDNENSLYAMDDTPNA